MFQGPAGTKGDKGERVSHSTLTLQPLFRTNQVLLLHFAVEILLFCSSKTPNNSSLMLHTPLFWRNQITLLHTCAVSCSSFAPTFTLFLFSLPQPRLGKTKSNQCSWFKFAAELFFADTVARPSPPRAWQTHDLPTWIKPVIPVSASFYQHLYLAAVNFQSRAQRESLFGGERYMTGFSPLCCTFVCGCPVVNKDG